MKNRAAEEINDYILLSFHLTLKGKEIKNEKVGLFFGNDSSLV